MNTLQQDAALKVISGIARKADFEVLGLDNVRAIKSDGEHPQYRPSAVPAVKDASDPEERTFTWQGSTEDVDSMGDVIKVGGWDLTRVKTGIAPLLLGHDSYPLPAGILQRATKSGKTEAGGRSLDITGRIHEQEIFGESEFGMWVEGARKLVANGTMKGSSVGFAPTSMRWPEEKEREELGMPPWGMIFEGQELLELSMTPIPANRNASRKKDVRAALKALVAEGQITDEAAEVLAEDLSLSQEAWLRRVQSLRKVVVPIKHTLPWIKGAKEAPAPTETAAPITGVDEAIARIEQAAKDALEGIRRDARREISAVSREILEPCEDAITEATDELVGAVKHLGLEREDSERAEVSEPRAPNGAKAATAASTGKSRDNPTTPTQSSASHLLLSALCPALAGTDANDAARRRSEAEGMQDRG